MFDIGGWEFLIIIVVAVIIVGPKDLPGVVKTASEWIRRARGLAREFQSGMEDLAREVELEKIGDEVKKGIGLDDAGESFRREIENTIDPSGDISDAFKESSGLQDEDVLNDELLYDDEYNDPIEIEESKPKPVEKKPAEKDVVEKDIAGKDAPDGTKPPLEDELTSSNLPDAETDPVKVPEAKGS